MNFAKFVRIPFFIEHLRATASVALAGQETHNILQIRINHFFKNSFFPSTIKEWDEFDLEIYDQIHV